MGERGRGSSLRVLQKTKPTWLIVLIFRLMSESGFNFHIVWTICSDTAPETSEFGSSDSHARALLGDCKVTSLLSDA